MMAAEERNPGQKDAPPGGSAGLKATETPTPMVAQEPFAQKVIQSAEELTELGFKIHPIHGIVDGRCTCGGSDCGSPGKHPVWSGWQENATTAIEDLKAHWVGNPHHNLGIATGPSKLAVVDLDRKDDEDGNKTLVEIERIYGPLPTTCVVKTPTGGRHIYCKHPSGRVKSTVRALGKGIDVRADGGNIVAPPSHHKCGGDYEWVEFGEPGEFPPGWVDLLRSGKAPELPEPVDLTTLARGPLKGAFEKVIAGQPFAEPGQRNGELARLMGAVAGKYPYSDPAAVEVLFKPSLDAMATLPADSPAPTMDTLRSMLERFQAEERANQPIEAGLAPTRQLRFAKDLVNDHGDDWMYCSRDWYGWNGSRFERDELGKLNGCIESVVKQAYLEACAAHDAATGEQRQSTGGLKSAVGGMQNAQAFAGIIKLAAPMVAVPLAELDRDGELLGTPEGTIDLRTGNTRPPDKSDRITKQTLVAPSKMPTPEWLSFLEVTFEGNDELISFVQRILGLALLGKVTEEILFVFWGDGMNGKTVILESVKDVLGDYALQISPDILLSGRSSKVDAERALLKGARLVICAESAQTRSLDDGNLKQLCSADNIVGKDLYKTPIRFPPSHQMILMTNHPPKIQSTDPGTWRRILMVPFNHTVPEEERIHGLKDQLVRCEGPGILQWLLDGCLEYQERGIDPPEIVKEATSSYRGAQDEVGQFLSECTQQVPGRRAGSADLYQRYRGWSGGQGQDTLGRKQFGQEMTRRFKKLHNNGIFYLGLELIEITSGF